MKTYIIPIITIAGADFGLLAASGPGADDIGSPNVLNDAKEYSVWDEDGSDNTLFNKEEQNCENWE